MSHRRISTTAAAIAIAAVPLGAQLRPTNPPKFPVPAATKYATKYTIDQFLSPSSPLEVGAAKKADKVAWVSYERGMRNIYVASAPDSPPRVRYED